MNEILVVIDCQSDFIDGVLGTKEAVSAVSNIAKKIESFKKEGNSVFATMDTHNQCYLETFEGEKLPIKHCIRPTSGWGLNNEIYEALTKNWPYFCTIEKSTFGTMELYNAISNCLAYEHGFRDFNIHLVGFCTDICVITNALLLRTQFPDIDIIVDSSCCAGTTPEMHEAALNVMRSCQIDVI